MPNVIQRQYPELERFVSKLGLPKFDPVDLTVDGLRSYCEKLFGHNPLPGWPGVFMAGCKPPPPVASSVAVGSPARLLERPSLTTRTALGAAWIGNRLAEMRNEVNRAVLQGLGWPKDFLVAVAGLVDDGAARSSPAAALGAASG